MDTTQADVIDTVLEVRNFRKTFRTGFWRRPVEAVRGISFEVYKGEVFGLIGPNGAGKTTTIKSALGLISPTAGTVSVLGACSYNTDVARRVGYLSESPYVYAHLKPVEFLDYCGRLFGLSAHERAERSEEILSRVGLTHAASRPMGKFSKGMLQRMGLAQALLGRPELLILDEPMSGLDPLGRREVQDIVEQEHAKGTTIIFTSHILSDVERLCDRIVVIRQGELQAYGRLTDIVQTEHEQVEVMLSLPADHSREEALIVWCRTSALKLKQTGRHLRVVMWYRDCHALIERALAADAQLISLQPERRSLQNLFLQSGPEATTSPYVHT